jgi:hypothetical protein
VRSARCADRRSGRARDPAGGGATPRRGVGRRRPWRRRRPAATAPARRRYRRVTVSA